MQAAQHQARSAYVLTQPEAMWVGRASPPQRVVFAPARLEIAAQHVRHPPLTRAQIVIGTAALGRMQQIDNAREFAPPQAGFGLSQQILAGGRGWQALAHLKLSPLAG
jgi:hypothetical protein